jgi:hypothetical protein
VKRSTPSDDLTSKPIYLAHVPNAFTTISILTPLLKVYFIGPKVLGPTAERVNA